MGQNARQSAAVPQAFFLFLVTPHFGEGIAV